MRSKMLQKTIVFCKAVNNGRAAADSAEHTQAVHNPTENHRQREQAEKAEISGKERTGGR